MALSIAEILKAKREAAKQQTETVELRVPVEVAQVVEAQPEKAVEVLKEAVQEATEKPLTFAEKLALKRKEQDEQKANPVPEASKLTPSVETITEVKQTLTPVEAIYADIQQKINELVSLSGMDLVNARNVLKKALMENPAACELMLDEDCGKLVAALRRVAMQDALAAEVSKSPSKKVKAKDVDAALTDAELDAFAAFDIKM